MTDASVTDVAVRGARGEPRTRRPAEEREAQIIDAAFEAFGQSGLDETRLDDIARIAGIAKGTIYLYFPTKEALFQEMIRRSMIARLDALETEPSLADPMAEFRRIVIQYWGYVNTAEFPVLYRLVTGVLPRFPELSQFFVERVSLRWKRLLQSRIDACVRVGIFCAEQAPESARMLHAMLMQHALMRANPHTCAALGLTDATAVLDRVLVFFHAAMRPTSHSPERADASVR
jgi:AcrR family transcriptional regulator